MAETIPWKFAFSIILGLFLLLVALYIVYGVLKKENPIFSTVPEALELEDAISCSYWRCVEGCASPMTRNTENFQCKEFCNPEWTDNGQTNGKICGDSAKEHPVEVSLLASSGLGQVITKNILSQTLNKKGEQNEFFVSPSGKNCQNLGSTNIVYVDNNEDVLLASEGKDVWSGCSLSDQLAITAGSFNRCTDKILIAPGTYYLWSSGNPYGIGTNVVVCSESQQTSQTTTVTTDCATNGGTCRAVTCASNEEQTQGNCPRPSAGSAVCCKAKS